MLKHFGWLFLAISFFITSINHAYAENLSIGASIVGGTMHIISSAVAKIITDKVPGLNVAAQNTTGPQGNLQLIERGEMKIGIATNLVLKEAAEGKAKWTMGKPLTKWRTILVVYPAYLQWITTDSKLKYVHDLNGKTVNVSAPGAGSDVAGTLVHDALGIKITKNHNVTSNGLNLLRDGRISAVLVGQGYPAPSYTDLQMTTNATMLQMTPEEVDTVVTKVPSLSKAVIPANAFKRQSEPLNTVSYWCSIVVSEDLSDDIVYNITKAVIENRDTIVAATSAGKDFQAENIQYAFGQVHPGAIKYYEEHGIKIK